MAKGELGPCLVLWDVDHTLIETRGLGGELYQRAFERAVGRPMQQKADVTGQTEPAILAATLKLHGIDDDERYQAAYAQALVEEYEKHSDDLRRRGRALPGAREALAALSKRPDVVQTVLSGNLRQVAEIKLRIFELDHYVDFDSGAYGDDDTYRPNLVRIAQQRAATRSGAEFTPRNTVIVGDSTHDVTTALEGGAAVVAVCTGRDDERALREAGANLVLPDPIDTERLVAALDAACGSR